MILTMIRHWYVFHRISSFHIILERWEESPCYCSGLFSWPSLYFVMSGFIQSSGTRFILPFIHCLRDYSVRYSRTCYQRGLKPTFLFISTHVVQQASHSLNQLGHKASLYPQIKSVSVGGYTSTFYTNKTGQIQNWWFYNKGYPPENTLTPHSRDFSHLFFECPIIYKICTKHGNDTALCKIWKWWNNRKG